MSVSANIQAIRDNEILAWDRRRAEPWTEAQLQRVRSAAIELVRSHRSVDAPDGEILTVVGGPAYWKLMSMLDRSDQRL